MRKFLFCLILFLSYPFFNLQAEWGNDCCEDCCDDCWNDWGCIVAFGEWLYFRPSIDTSILSEALSTGTTTNIVLLPIEPRFHSAWRAGLCYQFCNCFDSLCVRWTQLRTRDTRNHVATFGFPGFFFFDEGTARHSLNFDYYAFDGLWNHAVFRNCCFCMNVLAGVNYTWLGIKEKATAFSAISSASAKQVSHFWGIGPELGFDLNFRFFRCFSLVGRMTGTLLTTRVHASAKTLATNLELPLEFSFSTKPFWRVVPAWDFRAGLRIDRGTCYLSYYVEAGYELINYHRGLRTLDVTSTTIPEFSDANMQGLYVSAGLVF